MAAAVEQERSGALPRWSPPARAGGEVGALTFPYRVMHFHSTRVFCCLPKYLTGEGKLRASKLLLFHPCFGRLWAVCEALADLLPVKAAAIFTLPAALSSVPSAASLLLHSAASLLLHSTCFVSIFYFTYRLSLASAFSSFLFCLLASRSPFCVFSLHPVLHVSSVLSPAFQMPLPAHRF